MADAPRETPSESIHSAAASAHISHAVIATYAAAAALEVDGVHAVAGGQAGGIDPDRVPKGVRISSDGGDIAVELHLVTEWGAVIPQVAGRVDRHVREYLGSMIDLEPASVAIVVDDVVQIDR
ncbi:MAG: Asp23 family, cell envelope-related function [Gaiellales bacterium]|jgi:uncharacterized alkaline shock family protein YloU|nr:Asp23 family, cell envelope-related function [Gaiellales bacterium]